MGGHRNVVCLEGFVREINPPMSCVPCGHVVCKPCLEQWLRTNRTRSCPMCRVRITHHMLNRSLMDLVESHHRREECDGEKEGEKEGASMNVSSSSSTSAFVGRDRSNDLLVDKSEIFFAVIDNSGSMQGHDGKIFANHEGTIVKRGFGSVTRWEEAASKTKQIAEYNLKRGICSHYFLLNPTGNRWVEGVDCVVVDPSDPHASQKMKDVLFRRMLDSYNM